MMKYFVVCMHPTHLMKICRIKNDAENKQDREMTADIAVAEAFKDKLTAEFSSELGNTYKVVSIEV